MKVVLQARGRLREESGEEWQEVEATAWKMEAAEQISLESKYAENSAALNNTVKGSF